METKTVYQYDDDFYFDTAIILDDSDKSPSGSWNIPARCVELDPPVKKDGFKIKYINDAWEYEAEEKEQESPKPTLDELKKQKLQELKWERDFKEVEPIEYKGNLYDYDEKARDRISAAIIAMELQGEGATIEWTTADNADTPVTANDLKMIIAAVAVRSNKLHTAYRVAKEKVEAATTAAEVEACKTVFELDNIEL